MTVHWLYALTLLVWQQEGTWTSQKITVIPPNFGEPSLTWSNSGGKKAGETKIESSSSSSSSSSE